MSKIAKLNVEKDILYTVNELFKMILEKGAADVLLIPQDVPSGVSTVQTLVRDPEGVQTANPFAFVLPANSADILVRTTDQASKEKVVAMFRPCELRAVFELTKLNQITLDNITLISVDCLGTFPVYEYIELAKQEKGNLTLKLLQSNAEELGNSPYNKDLRTACQICEYPVMDSADVSICTLGLDMQSEILLSANTDSGEKLLISLGLELDEVEFPQSRMEVIDILSNVRKEKREELDTKIKENLKDFSSFLKVLAGCIKCHNCMNVCPICYCKECFFESDILEASPKQFMDKSKKKGILRMPLDTALYHIGRMNHMITSCVSCGMCESACPSKLPLLAIYHALGSDVQALFDYVAGRNLEEELPLATFKEEELEPA